ncbi:MAG: EF-hand domain-containing protein [Luteolibacter sp.]
MKTYRIQWILALIASTSAFAQKPGNRGNRRPPPVPPLFAVLDADHDGILSEAEIKAASEDLAKLDRNGDGQITAEELRMPPPPPKDGDVQKDPPPGGKRPVPPVIAVLDADHDGTVSAKEMEGAPESLKELDKDGDGELSPEELHPHGPPPPDEDANSASPPEEGNAE